MLNTIIALSSWFPLTLAARFMAGVAAGLTWGLVPGYARRMVDASQQGRAMAIALVGTPIALTIAPTGIWLGWRMVFGLIVSGVEAPLRFARLGSGAASRRSEGVIDARRAPRIPVAKRIVQWLALGPLSVDYRYTR